MKRERCGAIERENEKSATFTFLQKTIQGLSVHGDDLKEKIVTTPGKLIAFLYQFLIRNGFPFLTPYAHLRTHCTHTADIEKMGFTDRKLCGVHSNCSNSQKPQAAKRLITCKEFRS